MKYIVELRSAEGGEDSALFAKDLAAAYMKHFTKAGWKHRLVDGPADVSIEVQGTDLSELNNEPGGHRIQRVPPTERRGRVHTSTVTVAVIDAEATRPKFSFDEKDLKVEWYSGTGCGGQHRNKHQNSCRLTHVPSGVVATAQCRSRETSYAEAKAALIQRLQSSAKSQQFAELKDLRQSQTGSGERGDKIRTYRFQDNSVKDHRTGKQAAVDRVMAGNFNLLW